MPVDYKRVQGPESSSSYLLYVKKSKQSYTDLISKTVSGDRRKDGRKCNEPRRIYLKTGAVTQAKGSAYLELNKTKVICSVFDPREIPRRSDYSINGELYCELKFAPFSCEARRGHQPDAEEKEFSLNLKRALEPAVCRHEFPNFQVDVYAYVLENDGSALAAAITCAGLALADASVPMYDLVTASTVGIHGDLLLLDPTSEEEALCNTAPPPGAASQNHGLVTAAYSPVHHQVSEFVQRGAMDPDCVGASIQTLTAACRAVYPLIQQCLVDNVTKAFSEKTGEPADT
ncbi:exosome complex component MTR3-like [Bacillus rossius redtenbacheri]|uniref:exosome complex component MTR3-like n=1 Tax=Bacillus rossius redtenbacheri TaxID=93214 RepID=UPI002FDEA887